MPAWMRELVHGVVTQLGMATAEVLRKQMMQSIEGGDAAKVRELLAAGANVNSEGIIGDTHLNQAARDGQAEIVRILINAGAKVDAGVVSGNQIRRRDGTIEYISGVNTSLRLASDKGFTEIVAILIDSGANVNLRDGDYWTPLHFASLRGHSEIVRLLLDAGADCFQKNLEGKTPFELARRLKEADLETYWRLDPSGNSDAVQT